MMMAEVMAVRPEKPGEAVAIIPHVSMTIMTDIAIIDLLAVMTTILL
jgi:hypothetical protein